MNSIKKLAQRLIKFRDERDWAQFHNPKDLACAISIESGELLEVILWKTPEEVEEILESAQGRSKFEDEMADIFIYLILLAHATDTDLLRIASSKIDANETRYPIELFRGTSKKSSL